MAALGIGLVLGGATGGQIGGRVRQGCLVVCLLAVNGLLMALLPHLPNRYAMAGDMAVVGALDGALAVVVLTLTERLPPKEIRARAMAVLTFATFVAYPLSVALAGTVLARWSPAVMFDITGAGFVLVAAAGLASSAIRGS